MKRELVAFMCITMSLTSFAGHKENWNFKEQKDIKVIEIPYSSDSQSQNIEIAFSEKDNIKVYLWDDLLSPQNDVISLEQ